MKIGFMVSYFYPATGGEEELAFTIAKELAKKHEVHVFTSDRKDGKVFPREEVIANVHIHRSRLYFVYRAYVKFNPGIAFKHLKYDLDILHFQSIGFIFQDMAVILRRLFTRTKILNTPHGPFMALENYPEWQKVLRDLYRGIEYPINKLYHASCEDNPIQHRWMPRFGFRKETIHYLPPPVPDNLTRKVSQSSIKKFHLEKKFVISYLGRVQEYKGLEQVIRVLPHLKKVNKKLIFVMMGSIIDHEDKRLMKIAKELGVDDAIVFTGKVTDDEKLAVLDRSEIFVFPSEWEAFGIVMVEAMARGCAIVSTKTEGGLFLVHDEVEGFLFNYQDLLQLRDVLTRLMKEKNLRERMKKHNRSRVKEFLASKVVENYEQLYIKLLMQR